MTASSNELDDVRQIMRKLDRSITDARDRRLRKDEPPREPEAAPATPQPRPPSSSPGRFGAPNVGKARPMLRRDNNTP